ncbi:MAG: 5-formyltetrahydrofolate cyclo-ligase [Clostridia bacterium]|nr:5-formyltetrahydrofolate cyclo-ligase [Clostridia bacterium]
MRPDDKASLRIKYRAIRNNTENRAELQKRICRLFTESDMYKECTSVFLYSAVNSEVNIDAVFRKALSDGKKVAFPLCIDSEGSMEFYFTESPEDMITGMYGIKEPVKELCKKADYDENTVCLVPGLGFDKKGGRLGYGKGYYDRFLSEFCGESVGICFESCLSDSLSLDKHDVKVNYLITDKKIYIFKMEEE